MSSITQGPRFALRFTHEKGQPVDRPMYLVRVPAKRTWEAGWRLTSPEAGGEPTSWATREAAARNASRYSSETYVFAVEEIR